MIRVRITHFGEADMIDCLLHEMAHAAIGGEYDMRCCAELARVRGLGAPVMDFRLREVA